MSTVGGNRRRPDRPMVDKLPRRAGGSRCAVSRSGIEAAVTTTPRSRPFTSTARCRWTPLVFLAPSEPRLDGHAVGGGYRLQIDHRCGRAPVPPGRHPQSVAQRVEDACHAPPRAERANTLHRRGWGICTAFAATRYHRVRYTGWRPLSHGGNASRVFARPAVLPGGGNSGSRIATVRRSPTTSTPRTDVHPPRGAGHDGHGEIGDDGIVGSWSGRGLGHHRPNQEPILWFSARHTPPIAFLKHSLTPTDRSPPPPTDHRHASSGWGEAPLVLRVRVGST